MDRRCPNKGQPQGHIHRLLPANELHWNQGLVMGEGDDRVVFSPGSSLNKAIGRHGTSDPPAKRTNNRNKDLLLLIPKKPTFSRVRVERR